MNEIRLIDAMDGLRTIEDKSVGIIILDPPYKSLEKHREVGTTTRLTKSKSSSNEWFPTVENEYFDEFFVECYRVLKMKSHIFVMCDEETGDILKPKLRAAKFDQRKSLIWHKVGKMKEIKCPNCDIVVGEKRSPGTPGMSYPYRSCYEMILFFQKGKRKAAEDRTVRNVFDVPWIKSKGAYPTEKPVEIARRLIRQSSDPGDLVLDCFAGSGFCGEAAFLEGRNFLGFDVEQDALDHFKRRQQHWDWDNPTDAPEEEGDEGILEFFR